MTHQQTGRLYDKNGIPIERGDVVKIFHFTDRRRKKHFMFKQALGEVTMNKVQTEQFMKFSHLNMSDDYFYELCAGQSRQDFEIVQSARCDHENRQRLASMEAAQ